MEKRAAFLIEHFGVVAKRLFFVQKRLPVLGIGQGRGPWYFLHLPIVGPDFEPQRPRLVGRNTRQTPILADRALSQYVMFVVRDLERLTQPAAIGKQRIGSDGGKPRAIFPNQIAGRQLRQRVVLAHRPSERALCPLDVHPPRRVNFDVAVLDADVRAAGGQQDLAFAGHLDRLRCRDHFHALVRRQLDRIRLRLHLDLALRRKQFHAGVLHE